MANNETKRQHYVPRTYLKHFAREQDGKFFIKALPISNFQADKIQEILYGVIPQVLPLWISYSLYRFESNVRSATVVGMVGAGGIGVLLWESIRGFDFPATCAIMLIIIVTVTVIDALSQILRKRFI